MDISSTIHIILLLLAPVCAIFWTIGIMSRKNRQKAHNLISMVLVVFTVAYFLFISYFTPMASAVTDILYMAFALAIPVMHLLFYEQVTDPDGIRPSDYWLTIPNSILLLATITLYSILGKESSELFIQSVVLANDINVPAQHITTSWKLLAFTTYYGFRVILLMEILYVQIWAFFKVSVYNRHLDEYFSDSEQRGKKTNIIIYFSGLCAICAATGLLALPFQKLVENSFLFVAMSLITSVAVFCTGFASYRIEFTAEKLVELLKKNDSKASENESGIAPKSDDLDISERTYEQIVRGLMKLAAEKEFLKPELSLIDVSEAIGTNRTYLTKVIHSYFNCSFSDYINLLRIEYAEKILQDTPSMTMQEVAINSGFTTLSSFYRNFQKFTGTTPAKWMSA